MGAWLLYLAAWVAAALSALGLLLSLLAALTDDEPGERGKNTAVALYLALSTGASVYAAHTIAQEWL